LGIPSDKMDVVVEKVLAKVRALVEGTFGSYLAQECGIGAGAKWLGVWGGTTTRRPPRSGSPKQTLEIPADFGQDRLVPFSKPPGAT
jgi:hypothetical protein